MRVNSLSLASFDKTFRDALPPTKMLTANSQPACRFLSEGGQLQKFVKTGYISPY